MNTRYVAFVSILALLLACGSDELSNSGSGSPTSSGASSAAGASGGAGTGVASGGSAQGGSAQGGASQGGAGGGGTQCTWSSSSNSCGTGEYCNAPGCGTGTCVPMSMANDGIKNALCGCDGINYWNSTTASNYGMSIASSGECAQPKFCGGLANLQCSTPPAGHFCAEIGASVLICNVADNGGECWGMPKMCDAIVIGGDHRPCFGNVCATECEAIKSGVPHYPDQTCPM